MSDLENRLHRVEDWAVSMKEDIREVKTRIQDMPTKGELWRVVALSSGFVIVGLWGLVQFFAKPWLQDLIASIKAP